MGKSRARICSPMTGSASGLSWPISKQPPLKGPEMSAITSPHGAQACAGVSAHVHIFRGFGGEELSCMGIEVQAPCVAPCFECERVQQAAGQEVANA